MKTYETPLGKVKVAPMMPLFEEVWRAIEDVVHLAQKGPRCIALTGGSTPKAFYKWAAFQKKSMVGRWPESLYWTTSDERMVPMESDESNQGNGWRGIGEPLGIPRDNWFFWNTSLSSAAKACEQLEVQVSPILGPYNVYDLAFLGMGDDGHTASLFPGSPLLPVGPSQRFAAVEVPEKGWRLTVTPKGLARCREIIVMVTGKAKAERLAEILNGRGNIENLPIRLLETMADRVTWLVDPEAASVWLGLGRH